MTVTFFNKKQESRCSFHNVIQMNQSMIRHNGRLTTMWYLLFEDGKAFTLKVKDYDVERVSENFYG